MYTYTEARASVRPPKSRGPNKPIVAHLACERMLPNPGLSVGLYAMGEMGPPYRRRARE